MHLLLAQKGTISDGEEAVDLGQSAAEVLFLSAADTELSAIAGAYQPDQSFSLRVASLLALKHPMSVDAYVERTARHARLIVVRALGGASYFDYLLEALHEAARRSGAMLAVLPGDAKPDPGLARFSRASGEDLDRLWGYLVEGGAENCRRLLDYCGHMLGRQPRPDEPAPLAKAGIWWPGRAAVTFEEWQTLSKPHGGTEAPVAAIAFYRALLQSGETGPVEAMIAALQAEGLRPLPLFAYSLKDGEAKSVLGACLGRAAPDIVINTTGFANSAPGADRQPTVLETSGAVILQAIFSASSRESWLASQQGLTARDLAMNVALPEVDGRVLSRAVSFKAPARYDERVEANLVKSEPDVERLAWVARLARNWASLRRKPRGERRVALVLANYPNRDGRLGNGVGLDTPAATLEALRAMQTAGYDIPDLPSDGGALIAQLLEGPTNAGPSGRVVRERLSLKAYKEFFDSLPKQIQQEVEDRWGPPQADLFFADGAFALSFLSLGKLLLGIQPARGRDLDPKESYHSPDLVPPHGYFAFYAFIRRIFGADALIHMGKHGNLEWLPGKALALSQRCYPEALLGPMPHLYPFIVNDPGEGTQAKRRAAAVVIGHLTPPLTRAEAYGPLKDLEALVDEYYEAAGGDPRRLRLLSRQILDLVADIGLDRDAGISPDDDETQSLTKLDAYLCDLKEMQIRGGLHVFGRSPEGEMLTDLVVALARVPRGLGEGADRSLHRAIAADAGLRIAPDAPVFDPLDCMPATPWQGEKPLLLDEIDGAVWRSAGDAVERIELLAAAFVSGARACPTDWAATRMVLEAIDRNLRPAVRHCGQREIEGLLLGLDGAYVAPGPSGAPTRGRPDVLPTGRNFYSVDSRAVPTPAAYELGRKSAEALVRRYVQDHGEWPKSFGLTAWGTANMRSGGDDIAQALALLGVRPVWDMSSRRVTGYEILPQALLGRPRVDVVLRVSGFFRDAFPDQIALFDRAVSAVAALDEDEEDNPVAARVRAEAARLAEAGEDAGAALRRASYRVFGSRPGGYGAGLQTALDEGLWQQRADLAQAYLGASSYAYGAGEEGQATGRLLEERLSTIQAVVQNQDNREHDLLDSDEYAAFEGGMAAAAELSGGVRPTIYHNDHSRPEKPVIRTLEEEIGRVVRGRAVNPKWISGMMRHGYKGAFEMAVTVDQLFAFAATTGAVADSHFEAVYRAFLLDAEVHDFLKDANPAALGEIKAKLLDAIERGLWTPRSNSTQFTLIEEPAPASRQRQEERQ